MYCLDRWDDLGLPTSAGNIGPAIDVRTADIAYRPGSEREIRLEDGGSTIVYSSERNAVFKLLDGEEIAVDPSTIDSEEEIVLHLLGPLFRLLLLQRGEFILHASVVRIGTWTAAFIAPSGHGKSTMAAGLYDRGHDVLSDDAGIIRLASGPDVLAGPAVLKLREESAERITRGIEPIFAEGLESGKRFYHLTDNERPDRASLDAVYLLEAANEIELAPVSPRDATVAFVDNSWGLPDADTEVVAENFRRCSALAEAVPVTRLCYPRSFEVFDEVLTRIEGECTDDG